MKEESVKFRGKIVDLQKGDNFKIKINTGGVNKDTGEDITKIVSAYPSGKIRKNKIKLIVGDEVEVELSPYDLNNGRIVWVFKF